MTAEIVIALLYDPRSGFTVRLKDSAEQVTEYGPTRSLPQAARAISELAAVLPARLGIAGGPGLADLPASMGGEL